jgi:hypothetical protein
LDVWQLPLPMVSVATYPLGLSHVSCNVAACSISRLAVTGEFLYDGNALANCNSITQCLLASFRNSDINCEKKIYIYTVLRHCHLWTHDVTL